MVAENLRVTGISHRITPNKWLVSLDFASPTGVAAPTAAPTLASTPTVVNPGPSAGNNVVVSDSGGYAYFSFGKTYPVPPVVVGTGGNGEVVNIVAGEVTTTTFRAQFRNTEGAALVGPVRLFWIATLP